MPATSKTSGPGTVTRLPGLLDLAAQELELGGQHPAAVAGGVPAGLEGAREVRVVGEAGHVVLHVAVERVAGADVDAHRDAGQVGLVVVDGLALVLRLVGEPGG